MPGPELLIVVAIIAVLFGGSKIPQLARSLGSAKHEFEKGRTGSRAEDRAPAAAARGVVVTDDPPRVP